MLDSFAATKGLADTQLLFLLDKDDPSDYPGISIIGKPTGDPTGPLNLAAEASAADILGFIGDDSRLETPGWDLLVERALDKPGFCWGFDGTSPSHWPSTCFISSKIVAALGYMVPPSLKRGFFDVFWVQLASATGTARIIPAMFRHDNSAGDPASPNFKPERRVPPEVIAADELAFKNWQQTQMPEDIRKVRATDLARFFG